MPSIELICTGGSSDGKGLVLEERLDAGDEIRVPLSDDPSWFDVYALVDTRLEFVRRGRLVLQHRMEC